MTSGTPKRSWGRTRGVLAAVGAVAVALAAGCGGGGSSSGSSAPPPAPAECSESTAYESTFAAVQELIFERHGCTQQVCHGSSAQGGLTLTPDVAYANLIEAPSQNSAFPRVLPGDKDRSFLWLKLAAKTNPGSVEINGSPMPSGLPAISADELELVRRWIYGGAPETGTVAGTEELIDGCLPPPQPITIKPLDPPPPGEGVQFVMPPWHLPRNSEQEVCFASYYDFTDQVPEEFRDPSGTMLRFSLQELRQDPQSHHLILNLAHIEPEQLHHPSFGEWRCRGGERAGEACEPTDRTACGSGLCASDPLPTFACVGFGPTGGSPGTTFQAIGGAQEAQSEIALYDGVFAQIPMRGVLYWNSHAFNLTDQDHLMNGRLNYVFARDQRYPLRPIFDTDRIFSANAAPYTTQTLCHDHVLPRGARLFNLSSHTHKRGKHFTVDLPDGTRIYESFVYNDPVYQKYEPPLAFDAEDPAERTLRYCSLYNNGVSEDGSPDPEAVTRASRVPESAQAFIGKCTPRACTAGRIGASCAGEDDDATCDSSSGAGDGECDACAITGGESTENEMFILIGSYYLEGEEDPDDPINFIPGFGAPRAAGRSSFTGLALPPQRGCGTSHGMHLASAGEHAGH
jgi:hypothetical protein